MELSAFEIALFTGILGVGATLLGVIISYWLSFKLLKKQARMVAGAKLRAAFAPEIAAYLFYGMSVGDFKEALFRHAPAFEEYRIYVPPKSQRRYQKAWECYYEPFNGNVTQELIYKGKPELYRERIEAILKFAEPN